MNDRRISRAMTTHLGLSWALFWGFSMLALIAGIVIVALTTGSRTTAAMVVLIGLIVVGIAAALMDSIVSPLQNHGAHGQVTYGPRGGGGFGVGGSGSDSGGCGDGGSCS